MNEKMRSLRVMAYVITIAISAISVSAQRSQFRWGYPGGTYTGIFDAKKYSKQLIENTYSLMDYRHIYMFEDNSVFAPPHISESALRTLEEAYKKDVADLESLEVIPQPFWQRLKQKKIAQLHKYYELSRTTILGYSDPKAFLEFNGAAGCKNVYAKPLISGGDKLLQVWRQVNIRSRKVNSEPENIRRKYEEQRASADRQKFAFEEVIGFGWWNCVVNEINRVGNKKTMENEFHRLFTRIFYKKYPQEDIDDYYISSF